MSMTYQLEGLLFKEHKPQLNMQTKLDLKLFD